MKDIYKAISANPIRNGSEVQGGPLGFMKNNLASGIDTQYASNSPTITQIEEKYTNRFDDETYYTA